MQSLHQQLEINLERLKDVVSEIVKFYDRGLDYNIMVYELWSAKNILGHITFWHESFARNISDLAHDRKPSPLKGKLSEVNKLSVESTDKVSIKELMKRLQQAQHTIEKNIFNDKINLIPYKKGSRDYSRNEHLEVVTTHIRRHLNDLEEKYGTTKK